MISACNISSHQFNSGSGDRYMTFSDSSVVSSTWSSYWHYLWDLHMRNKHRSKKYSWVSITTLPAHLRYLWGNVSSQNATILAFCSGTKALGWSGELRLSVMKLKTSWAQVSRSVDTADKNSGKHKHTFTLTSLHHAQAHQYHRRQLQLLFTFPEAEVIWSGVIDPNSLLVSEVQIFSGFHHPGSLKYLFLWL